MKSRTNDLMNSPHSLGTAVAEPIKNWVRSLCITYGPKIENQKDGLSLPGGLDWLFCLAGRFYVLISRIEKRVLGLAWPLRPIKFIVIKVTRVGCKSTKWWTLFTASWIKANWFNSWVGACTHATYHPLQITAHCLTQVDDVFGSDLTSSDSCHLTVQIGW